MTSNDIDSDVEQNTQSNDPKLNAYYRNPSDSKAGMNESQLTNANDVNTTRQTNVLAQADSSNKKKDPRTLANEALIREIPSDEEDDGFNSKLLQNQ